MTEATRQTPAASLDGTVAVISPHLDDAVLSLGATIARWARQGAHVVVVTVLANDPDVAGGASPWDRSAGFGSRREAAQSRRIEDAKACALLGAEPAWLPFGDKEHPRGGTDAEIREALERIVGDANAVVVPGYPLTQAGGDHLFITRLALELTRRPPKLGLYVEQPYAANRLIRRLTRRATPLPFGLERLGWRHLRPTLSDWQAKQAAIASYESQHPLLGPLLRTRIAFYELVRGGEGIAWLAPSDISFARQRIAPGVTEIPGN